MGSWQCTARQGRGKTGVADAELPALIPVCLHMRRADHTGQAALHWAAVRGATAAAEALLRGGAAASARDGRGYSIAHVAAQYGQTAFLHRLALRWGIDVDWCAAAQRWVLFLREWSCCCFRVVHAIWHCCVYKCCAAYNIKSS